MVAIQITIQPAINKPTEGEIKFRTAREFIIFYTLKTIKRYRHLKFTPKLHQNPRKQSN
ncbi:hypothetical protein SynSYN20_03424 [Synechococcus sp. SYN20]|nr:hypothetical protein SynSYN20_03424 [Synechococcus sp. SYN20]